jgi:hypothetical protein
LFDKGDGVGYVFDQTHERYCIVGSRRKLSFFDTRLKNASWKALTRNPYRIVLQFEAINISAGSFQNRQQIASETTNV